MESKGNRNSSVAVVGAGLVGSLNACFLARRGFRVNVYEYREDMRTMEHVQGRSINLAMSYRGRQALAAVGMEADAVSCGIPMRARMIHDQDGRRRPIPYGTTEQYIMSIDRRKLNELLLTKSENQSNVRLNFGHKLTSCNLKTGVMTFEKENKEVVQAQADVICGCDGAFSAVRQQMLRRCRVDFSQEYIPHGYIELCMPPNKETGEHAMEVNYLHIWPRGKFMLIALPNLDKTYTVTLFMPFEIFESILHADDVIKFFEQYFPDAIDLLGEKQLVHQFLRTKPQPLISVKCSSYNVDGRVVLLGDAAHAMVPFYGQGMNAGFEDCIILDEILEANNNDFDLALVEFSTTRGPDAHAICDLAMYNYIEMRDLVNSSSFLMRKKLDNFLHWIMPKSWVPLYTSVAFTRIPYKKCVNNRKWQDKVLTSILWTFTIGVVCGVGGFWYFNREIPSLPENLFYLRSPSGKLIVAELGPRSIAT